MSCRGPDGVEAAQGRQGSDGRSFVPSQRARAGGTCWVNESLGLRYVPVPGNATSALEANLSRSGFRILPLRGGEYADCFSFTVLRDPFDRFAGAYIEMKNEKEMWPFLFSDFGVSDVSLRIAPGDSLTDELRQFLVIVECGFFDERLDAQTSFLEDEAGNVVRLDKVFMSGQSLDAEWSKFVRITGLPLDPCLLEADRGSDDAQSRFLECVMSDMDMQERIKRVYAEDFRLLSGLSGDEDVSGCGVLASVLIPSRGRIDCLLDVIESFTRKTRDIGRVEFLIRLDLDDADSIAGLLDICGDVKWAAVVGEAMGGYVDQNVFHNELARVSEGDWIFVFADDSIVSDNWDVALMGASEMVASRSTSVRDGVFVLRARAHAGLSNPFPIISRGFYRALGHVSLSNHSDTYVEWVSRGVGCEVDFSAIEIQHSMLRDEIGKRGVEVARHTIPKLYGPDTRREVLADIDAIVQSAPRGRVMPHCSRFEREAHGLGYRASILLAPTGGVDGCLAALESFRENTSRLDLVEFLIGLSGGDSGASCLANETRDLNCKVLVDSRDGGGKLVHEWYNDLCSLASGRWYVLFDDEHVMDTWGWDAIVDCLRVEDASFDGGGFVGGFVADGLVPIVTKELFYSLGHVALDVRYQRYIAFLLKLAGCEVRCSDVRIAPGSSEAWDDWDFRNDNGLVLADARVLLGLTR